MGNNFNSQYHSKVRKLHQIHITYIPVINFMQHWKITISIITCEMNIFIHSQTLKVQPLMCMIGLKLAPHTLPGMRLQIYSKTMHILLVLPCRRNLTAGTGSPYPVLCCLVRANQHRPVHLAAIESVCLHRCAHRMPSAFTYLHSWRHVAFFVTIPLQYMCCGFEKITKSRSRIIGLFIQVHHVTSQ